MLSPTQMPTLSLSGYSAIPMSFLVEQMPTGFRFVVTNTPDGILRV